MKEKTECNFSCTCPRCGTDEYTTISYVGGTTIFGLWAQVVIECKRCGRERHSAKIPVMYKTTEDEEVLFESTIADAMKAWNKK